MLRTIVRCDIADRALAFRLLKLLVLVAVANLPAQDVQAQEPPAPAILSSRQPLWKHLSSAKQLVDQRGMTAALDTTPENLCLRLNTDDTITDNQPSDPKSAWVAIPLPQSIRNLSEFQSVSATIKNTSAQSLNTTFWVVGSDGWSAVGANASIPPNQSSMLTCNLRECFADGTPKVDPRSVQQVCIMVQRGKSASMEVTELFASGRAARWVSPASRLNVPTMDDVPPAAGRRVRYQLKDDGPSETYSVLYLPKNWSPDRRYPVIAEFPGNFFCVAQKCWSTGRPEQCVIGYGVTKGDDAIWISLPFVDKPNGRIAESGFGSADGDDTADYAERLIDDVCKNWGGDANNIILSGFSRGAIACGYIGLRNDTIARRWKGFIACQHYDGSKWKQSNLADAVHRAPRFRGQAIFQIDNSLAKYQAVVDATNPDVKWTWAQSGLGDHDTAMFLDDRQSTQQLRKWWKRLVADEGITRD